MAPYLSREYQDITQHLASYGILWLLGVAAIAFFTRDLRRHAKLRTTVEDLLRVSRANYKTVIENSLTGIYIVQDEKIVFSNSRFAGIFGYSEQEVNGMTPDLLTHPDDRATVATYHEKRMNGEEAPREYEVRGLRRDGRVIWLRRMVSVIEYGGRPSMLGNVLDVTHLKETESALREQTAELKRSNEELERFAFLASHDLNEPLRKIQSFGNMIGKRLNDSIDEKGRDYLVRMQNAAARMQTMINALLAYSRTTSRARPFTRVNLHDAVSEALSNLEVNIQETGADILCGDLPVIEADREQMIQLFQNLIGNALKFRHKDRAPRVRIHGEGAHESSRPGEERREAFCRIYVEDEGIGFDMKYLDRIFHIFERLHGGGTYEGSGIGLGICRKIVERHHGEITARSEPGKGATFIVTLPVGGTPGRRDEEDMDRRMFSGGEGHG